MNTFSLFIFLPSLSRPFSCWTGYSRC